VVHGNFRDYETVLNFGSDKDLISYEIEDVNLDALKFLESQGKKVYPQPKVLEIIKNKWNQKKFLVENGFPTADFMGMNQKNPEEIASFLPAFWKQNEGGYDGKGVSRVKDLEDFELLPEVPGFLEKAVEIKKELAVIVARNENGEIQTFPCVEMIFHPIANLVEYLQTPATISEEVEITCKHLAIKLAEKLDLVGLMAIEFFLDTSEKVLINEMAPRPHNSGHHTIECCFTSQFAQHLRSILNLPLGNTGLIMPGAMLNVLGAPGYEGTAVYEGLEDVLSLSGVYVHLYGKSHTKPFRKMGHVTMLGKDLPEIKVKVEVVKNKVKCVSKEKV
jgi:5-(carboxyamino)imidazole ribonucleotide synthase